jgi:hypothetical protein
MPPRKRVEIEADISAELRSIKPGVCAEVSRQIDVTISVAASAGPVTRAHKIREKAEKADRAAAALLATLGGVEPDVERFRQRVARYRNATGPDQRFDTVKWLCAHTACVLVEKFSRRRPTTSRGGKLHHVANLIHEAVTGKPASKAGMLRACRSVLKWRKFEQDTAE